MQQQISLESVSATQQCFCSEPDKANYVKYEGEYREVILCTKCGTERRDVALETGEDEDDTDGLDCQRNTTKIHSYHTAKTKITPGTHIAWKRAKGVYSHHAIVETLDGSTIGVIQYEKCSMSKKMKIKRKQLDMNNPNEMHYDRLFCINYTLRLVKLNPPSLVIQRAIAMLGETGYNILFNNCESFANFCKRGISRSLQVARRACGLLCELGKELKAICLSPRILMWSSEFVTAEGIEAVASATTGVTRANVIGAFLFVAAEGILLSVNIYKLFELRNDAVLSKEQFKAAVIDRIGVALIRCAVGVFSSIAAGIIGARVGGAIGGMIVPGAGIVVGAVVGGFAGSIIGGVGGVASVHGTRSIMWSYKNSVDITSIENLYLGDHIIRPGNTLFHPRCHAIVSGIDIAAKQIKIITNDYDRCVVEESVPFVEMKKMKYGLGECYTVPEVLKRARSKLGKRRYSIATYNCKTFAREQKQREELNF